ncbi:MAG: hypothetical protein L3J88_00150 [Gammaproteobacteria bacterium]|nr:hypothetical protein [Gammaproteobacteria bacterium]
MTPQRLREKITPAFVGAGHARDKKTVCHKRHGEKQINDFSVFSVPLWQKGCISRAWPAPWMKFAKPGGFALRMNKPTHGKQP